MSDLDEKLREVKVSVWHAGQGTFEYPLDDKNIEQIKQAFKEAGYVYLQQHPAAIIPMKIDLGLMTGQEFFDRFEEELDGWLLGAYSDDCSRVLEAARKAAGLD